jgi:hypothetical protein
VGEKRNCQTQAPFLIRTGIDGSEECRNEVGDLRNGPKIYNDPSSVMYTAEEFK